MKSLASTPQLPPTSAITSTTSPVTTIVVERSSSKTAAKKTASELSQMPACNKPKGSCSQVKNCSLVRPNRWRIASMPVTTRSWRSRGAKCRALSTKPSALPK